LGQHDGGDAFFKRTKLDSYRNRCGIIQLANRFESTPQEPEFVNCFRGSIKNGEALCVLAVFDSDPLGCNAAD
jgi:hypothetical protein